MKQWMQNFSGNYHTYSIENNDNFMVDIYIQEIIVCPKRLRHKFRDDLPWQEKGEFRKTEGLGFREDKGICFSEKSISHL